MTKSAVFAIILAVCAAGSAQAGSEHGFGRAAGNCGGAWKLPDTGQTASYTATFGEDHDYQPVAVQPKYAVLNPVGVSSVTVDNVTGLMWVTNPVDALIGGLSTWEGAIGACEGMVYATYSDWRLPNLKELLSIVDYGRANPSIDTTYFLNTFNGAPGYWSSTSVDAQAAHSVLFDLGNTSTIDKIDLGGPFEGYIRCIRGGL